MKTREELQRFFKIALNHLLETAKPSDPTVISKLSDYTGLSLAQISRLRNLDGNEWSREDKRRRTADFFGLEYEYFLNFGECISRLDMGSALSYWPWIRPEGPGSERKDHDYTVELVPGAGSEGKAWVMPHGVIVVHMDDKTRFVLNPAKDFALDVKE